jgi:hypothetical protein
MRPISEATRQNIIGDLQAGYSIRQVAYRTNVGRTTVNKVAAEHLPNRKKPKGGKPLKLKEADKRYCVRQITRGGQKGNAISVQCCIPPTILHRHNSKESTVHLCHTRTLSDNPIRLTRPA